METKNLKPGDVLLCPPIAMPEGWIGQIIVLLTKGKVSHAALYCGERNGEPQVAHSDLRGIIYMSLKDFIDEEPGFYVARHKDKTDLIPVLNAVTTYTDKGIPYPVTNFAILGMLILFNRFSKDKINNHVFYVFALFISYKLIKEINARKFSEKSMSCSQFTSQCFTDAGIDYNITFEKLMLQYGGLKSTNDEVSLFDYIKDDVLLDTVENNIDEEYLLNNENNIIQEFIALMRGEQLNSPLEKIPDSLLSAIGQKFLKNLCEIFTNKKPATVKGAIDELYKIRNYFVLPDDLLSNTKNLQIMGYFDKSSRR